MTKIEEIQQMIRDLRDSENHVCPEDEGTGECSCGEYDLVNDELDKLKYESSNKVFYDRLVDTYAEVIKRELNEGVIFEPKTVTGHLNTAETGNMVHVMTYFDKYRICRVSCDIVDGDIESAYSDAYSHGAKWLLIKMAFSTKHLIDTREGRLDLKTCYLESDTMSMIEELNKEHLKWLTGELRRQTGAGLMDCKKALSNNEFDVDKAKKYLDSNEFYKGKLITKRRV